jgi:hypothetical protein
MSITMTAGGPVPPTHTIEGVEGATHYIMWNIDGSNFCVFIKKTLDTETFWEDGKWRKGTSRGVATRRHKKQQEGI